MSDEELTTDQLAALGKIRLDEIREVIAATDFSRLRGGDEAWLTILVKDRTLYPGDGAPERVVEVIAMDTFNADGYCFHCGAPGQRRSLQGRNFPRRSAEEVEDTSGGHQGGRHCPMAPWAWKTT